VEKQRIELTEGNSHREIHNGCRIMADWVMPLFTIVVAVALFVEALVMAASFIALRRLIRRIEQITERIQSRVFPLISQVQLGLEEVQPRISNAVVEASDFTHSARKQAERTDRMITEISNDLRTQFVHADQGIIGTLELIEDTGSRIRRAVLAPVRSIRALTAGIQTGINVYRTRFRQPAEPIGLSEDWIPPQVEASDSRT
jgi:hypothetical protein